MCCSLLKHNEKKEVHQLSPSLPGGQVAFIHFSVLIVYEENNFLQLTTIINLRGPKRDES